MVLHHNAARNAVSFARGDPTCGHRTQVQIVHLYAVWLRGNAGDDAFTHAFFDVPGLCRAPAMTEVSREDAEESRAHALVGRVIMKAAAPVSTNVEALAS